MNTRGGRTYTHGLGAWHAPRRLAAALALALPLAAGCGGSNTYNPHVLNTVQEADFVLSVSPASRTVAQGQTTTYTVTVQPANGYSSATALVLSGAPANTTASFTPASVTPTDGAATSKITVATTAPNVETNPTPTGTFTLTVTATGGGKTHTATATLQVTAAPDFTIGVSPSSQPVTLGQTAHYTVTLTATGFTSSVALTVGGLPANTTATFSPASVVPTAGGATSTLDVVTTTPNGTSGTPLGTATLTITGTGGGRTHSVTAGLVVNQTAPGSLTGTIQ